jgi:hypothetical protein
MAVSWNDLAQRAQGRGPNGELSSLATGKETDAELRSLLIQLTEKCPLGNNHHGCPFRMMGRLPDYSIEHLVTTMSPTDVRELFRMELICRKMAFNGQAAQAKPGT